MGASVDFHPELIGRKSTVGLYDGWGTVAMQFEDYAPSLQQLRVEVAQMAETSRRAAVLMKPDESPILAGGI